METRSTIKDGNDTRKEFKVLKDWKVTDTTLPYYGSHAPGSVVLVHEDVAAPLVEEGTLEAVDVRTEQEEMSEPVEEPEEEKPVE